MNVHKIWFVVLPLLVTGKALAACPIFPADNIWNTPVAQLPVDSRSSAYIASIGSSTGLHPDFGSGTWNGGPIGIPYATVGGAQSRVPVSFDYADESDPGPYPIPPNAPIEGGPNSTGDRHVLVMDTANCKLYELWDSHPQADGSWRAGSGAVFALDSNALRPATWTSADAAGLPILPGLARCEEIATGAIRHALRFTASRTQKKFVWPARHYASSITDPNVPPMGQRFRLKASFDISGYSPQTQIILAALKTYGMFLADNGSNWYISGSPGACWDDDRLVSELRTVTGSAFEAVDQSGLMVNADSGQAKTSSATAYVLTVRTTGGNGTVASQPAGIVCGTNCTKSYAASTTVTLTATPAAGYHFVGWSGCASAASTTCTVHMTAAQSVTATFSADSATSYSLVVTKVGTGTVTSAPVGINCGTSCNKSYATNTTVTLTATPAAGWQFAGWTGACTGTGTCTVAMTAAKSVTATFKPKLTVGKVGLGTVTSSPAGINCGATCAASFPANGTVTLTAAPAAGWKFAGWSGACTGTGTCSIAMTAAKSVTATFKPKLTVSKVGSGTVTSSPAGINCGATCAAYFPYKGTVTLTAAPASGQKLKSWAGCTAASGNTCTVGMTAAKTVTATFGL